MLGLAQRESVALVARLAATRVVDRYAPELVGEHWETLLEDLVKRRESGEPPLSPVPAILSRPFAELGLFGAHLPRTGGCQADSLRLEDPGVLGTDTA
ncbi:MAG: hypothetical protein GEV11_19610 [Streptosporangiales bacterium]|nr:hypothetical protein [Streptosporangiales bacterium]